MSQTIKREAEHCAQEVGGPDTAIRTEGDGLVGQLRDQINKTGACEPHHRAARSVETHRPAPGHVGQFGSAGSGLEFFRCTDRFDPKHIGPASFQPFCLFVKHFDRTVVG